LLPAAICRSLSGASGSQQPPQQGAVPTATLSLHFDDDDDGDLLDSFNGRKPPPPPPGAGAIAQHFSSCPRTSKTILSGQIYTPNQFQHHYFPRGDPDGEVPIFTTSLRAHQGYDPQLSQRDQEMIQAEEEHLGAHNALGTTTPTTPRRGTPCTGTTTSTTPTRGTPCIGSTTSTTPTRHG
jgi:hypothetical protein